MHQAFLFIDHYCACIENNHGDEMNAHTTPIMRIKTQPALYQILRFTCHLPKIEQNIHDHKYVFYQLVFDMKHGHARRNGVSRFVLPTTI